MKSQSLFWFYLLFGCVFVSVECISKAWNTTDGVWSDPNNWNPSGVPTAADDVLISPSINSIITIDVPVTIQNLQLNNSILFVEQNLNVTQVIKSFKV